MLLIYDACYAVFFWLKRLGKRFSGLRKVVQEYGYYFSLLLNRKFVPWFEKHPVKWGLNEKKRKEQYIVSLTSFPARIDYVHITVETLLRQTFKPDKILLWLAESQFPDKKLPEKLTALCDRGLTIRWCDDLRSHKKYFYAMQEFSDANIILADDDILYSRDMVATLAKFHKKYPEDIIASTAALIDPELSALPSVWVRPKYNARYVGTQRIQPYSGQGTLYPARWYPQELFNKEKALALAGSADDMWLHAMCVMAGKKSTLLHPQRGFPVNVEIENDQPLFSVNNSDGGNLNDVAWASLVAEFRLKDFDEGR